MTLPSPRQVVRVRARRYLVDEVEPHNTHHSTTVRLSCLEDDAQGERLEVLWERELDAQILDAAEWAAIAERGFDPPARFAAYLHAVRWSFVTATSPQLLQAPWRAGIEVKSYQLEPLRRALSMPRVNLFIADDVGLGKTIEAGLILRELLIRQKVRRVVIAAPPSVTRQWQEEMEERFGLRFALMDRAYVQQQREQRGFSINPWHTHTSFIISHALLRDEAYTSGLRDWLSESRGAMLILDEAHHFAPASGSRYAIDSQLTRTIRDLAPRFEHRLFLSATPHNGHSNSFAALLEILDPTRFCRGVPVADHRQLGEVLVRRLKCDLRELQEDFPARRIVQLRISDLPKDAPELVLGALLQDYATRRRARLATLTHAQRQEGMLVLSKLQSRLLSSIDAFWRTLRAHRRGLERQRQRALSSKQRDLLRGAVEDLSALEDEDSAADLLTSASASPAIPSPEEIALLDRMEALAADHRFDSDPRVLRMLAWIKEHMCPDLGKRDARWNDTRVIIFTEYTDTVNYLRAALYTAIEDSHDGALRMRIFNGSTDNQNREAIKRAFNADPAREPLRILLATDAAREGINLQNHCADLFHFDIPWNPGRLEQRNGRIDRKLQRAPEVRCHYFTLTQRPEDAVLERLVEKTHTIVQELGSLTPVLDSRITNLLERGIGHTDATRLLTALRDLDHRPSAAELLHVQRELEQARTRHDTLRAQLRVLNDAVDESRRWLDLDAIQFKQTLDQALTLIQPGAQLTPLDPKAAVASPETARYGFPLLGGQRWSDALDALRPPRDLDQREHEWRAQHPPRPVIFRDPGTLDAEVVHLHLEHRVVQRLLQTFLAHGFARHQLARATALRTQRVAQPLVLLLGRLSIWGDGGARLHDELLCAAAEWSDHAERGAKRLRPLGEDARQDLLEVALDALASPADHDVPAHALDALRATAARDVEELTAGLESRAETVARNATAKLTRRGEQEGNAMTDILRRQMDRIVAQQKQVDQLQLSLIEPAERSQLDADRRHWERRLDELQRELREEPARIRDGYTVRAQRLEPLGLIYLWPTHR